MENWIALVVVRPRHVLQARVASIPPPAARLRWPHGPPRGPTRDATNARPRRLSDDRDLPRPLDSGRACGGGGQRFTFGLPAERMFLSTQNVLANPVEAPTGIEPV